MSERPEIPGARRTVYRHESVPGPPILEAWDVACGKRQSVDLKARHDGIVSLTVRGPTRVIVRDVQIPREALEAFMAGTRR